MAGHYAPGYVHYEAHAGSGRTDPPLLGEFNQSVRIGSGPEEMCTTYCIINIVVIRTDREYGLCDGEALCPAS